MVRLGLAYGGIGEFLEQYFYRPGALPVAKPKMSMIIMI